MQSKLKLSLIITFIFIAVFLTTTSAQWEQLNSGTEVKLTGVAVIDSSSAIVIGEKGTILKTVNSGYSWKKIDLGITNNFNVISNRGQFFFSKSSIIAAGDSVLAISSDSGRTWQVKNEPYNFTTIDQGFTSPLRKTLFSPDSTIILGTEDGKIVYSLDKGNTRKDTSLFSSKVIAANFDLAGIVPLGSGTGARILAASSSKYVKGNIAGNDWLEYNIELYIPWQNITSGELAYNYKFIAGEGGELKTEPLLLRKEESDSTWTNISKKLPLDLLPNKIKITGFALFICGRKGKMLKSTDNGDTWIELKTSANTSLNDVDFYQNKIGYAVGDSGTILYTDNGGITAVKGSQKIIPAEFKLYQNYPNPFNPNTTIKYSIPETGLVQLTVYNNIGQKIKTLVNSNMTAGNHSVNFDAEELPSGVYFYEIRFKNEILAKKMLFLK